MSVISLSDLNINGQEALVTSIHLDDDDQASLGDYGLVPGTFVKFLTKAPFGGPISVCLRNSKMAVRNEVAAKIHVQLVA